MPVKKCDDIQEGAVESTTEAPEIEVTRVTVTPSQVRENVYLGKNITAVESNIYDASTVSLSKVSAFGDGYVTTARPSDIADALRAEALRRVQAHGHDVAAAAIAVRGALGPELARGAGRARLRATDVVPDLVLVQTPRTEVTSIDASFRFSAILPYVAHALVKTR